MNKIRILGLLLLAVGVGLTYYPGASGFDFLSGLLIGLGLGLMITGKIYKFKG